MWRTGRRKKKLRQDKGEQGMGEVRKEEKEDKRGAGKTGLADITSAACWWRHMP